MEISKIVRGTVEIGGKFALKKTSVNFIEINIAVTVAVFAIEVLESGFKGEVLPELASRVEPVRATLEGFTPHIIRALRVCLLIFLLSRETFVTFTAGGSLLGKVSRHISRHLSRHISRHLSRHL